MRKKIRDKHKKFTVDYYIKQWQDKLAACHTQPTNPAKPAPAPAAKPVGVEPPSNGTPSPVEQRSDGVGGGGGGGGDGGGDGQKEARIVTPPPFSMSVGL